MEEILNTLMLYMIAEHDYFADKEIQKEYPDMISMVQDSLQGELENDINFSDEKRRLLGLINKLIKDTL
jgi:Mor family transcriptional regulator